ncbi:hypothetical protein N7526_000384 [Penicillium atrosanguineum]|nr:hypothetical protein N7526_000384 [Penicillium atrosanguineum]
MSEKPRARSEVHGVQVIEWVERVPDGKMGPRRSHRKSRNGCPECKTRRLKCDERYPCTNCVKHGIPCSYVVPTEQDSTPASSASPASQAQAHIQPSSQPPCVNHAPIPHGDYLWNLANSGNAVESPNRLDLLGILPRSSQDAPVDYEDWGMVAELMHHYCTVTCNTLTRREDVRHVWRVIIPTEGYANKYVMNGVLAIAAIHRAYLYPSQKDKYTKASAYHLAAGLKEFRELISSPIDRDNWQPVFCFSSMICMHISTATIRLNADRLPTPLSTIIEIFASVKGFQAVMKPFLRSLQKTQLAPMVNSVWIEDEPSIPSSPALVAQSLLPPDVWTQVSRLRKFVDEYPFPQTQSESQHQDPDDDEAPQEHSDIRKDYKIAMEFFEVSARQIELAGPHVETGMVFLWAYPLSKRFHDHLISHHPAALVLLAHYCVLLHMVDHFWYMSGIGRQLLEDIETKTHPAFREWLVWPRRWVLKQPI